MKLATAFALIFVMAVCASAHAASSINTTQPVQGVPYNAAPIRQNFGDAASDINALQSMNAGPTAPANPSLGTLWLNTPQNATTYILNIWDNRQSLWLPIAYLDSLNNIWMTNVGGGLPTSLLAQDTTDLGSAPQALITITGAGPVYSFGTSAPPGIVKFLSFTGATQLVYNSTSLILPGGSTITTSAGDMALATALGSGNWQVFYYTSAALIVGQGGTGRTSLTAHAALLGEGTSPVNFAVPGTAGYPLLSQGATSDPAFGQLVLASGVTGILPVPNGGTGDAILPQFSVLLGNGTGGIANAAPAASGYPLLSTGTLSNPVFGAVLSGIYNGAPSNNSLFFPTYTQNAAYAIELPLSGTIGDTVNSFQDTLYVQSSDSDTKIYAYPHTNYGGRFATFGPNDGVWQNTSKNIVGLYAYGLGATIGTVLTQGPVPIISGLTADAYQYGAGNGGNVFSAHNPSAANGSLAQALTLFGVEGIVDNSYAAASSGHLAYSFLAGNIGGDVATAAFGAAGPTQYLSLLDAGSAVVTTQGIVMPGSASGFVGTKINYGTNNGAPSGGAWTDWLGSTNGGQYRWFDGSNGGLPFFTADLSSGVNMFAPGGGSANGFTANSTGSPTASQYGFQVSGNWQYGLAIPASTNISTAGIYLGNTSGTNSKIEYDSTDYTNFALISTGVYGYYITVGASNFIIIPSMPSSDPHIGGALWSNSGVITRSSG
jgi:hypothetical protein